MSMNWTETGYHFPEPDPGAASYLEDYGPDGDCIVPYGFRTIPELRELIRERLGTEFDERQILEIAKTAFRNRPKETDTPELMKDRKPVDFVYTLF